MQPGITYHTMQQKTTKRKKNVKMNWKIEGKKGGHEWNATLTYTYTYIYIPYAHI